MTTIIICYCKARFQKCIEVPRYFLRNKKGQLRPLCNHCVDVFEEVLKPSYGRAALFDVSDDLTREYVCQEVMES